MIVGSSAGEIAESIRGLVDTGELTAGASLPPVRTLAESLGVNRNTVVAAYRQLSFAGVVSARGRAGTVISRVGRARRDEGVTGGTVLTDVGTGNPSPEVLPGIPTSYRTAPSEPVLYGAPLIEPDLAGYAMSWLASDLERSFRLSLASGAVDAVERLLSQALAPGDAVALEDPCFLSSINTVQLCGYKTLPVPVDTQGMTVDGLTTALKSGARAVVCTPRAHNPTGASLSGTRSAQLREVLKNYPYVLVIEDDHFSQLSNSGYHTIISPAQERWALVRSVSKFLGPDMRLAFVASDDMTAERLAQRLSPGSMWVSHYLQRLASAFLRDTSTAQSIADARRFYRSQNRAFATALELEGIKSYAEDGLNVWLDTGARAVDVAAELMHRGWLGRLGDDFALTPGGSSTFLRLTIHTLSDEQQSRLIFDLSCAINRQRSIAPGV